MGVVGAALVAELADPAAIPGGAVERLGFIGGQLCAETAFLSNFSRHRQVALWGIGGFSLGRLGRGVWGGQPI
jgi:hypothetical protein